MGWQSSSNLLAILSMKFPSLSESSEGLHCSADTTPVTRLTVLPLFQKVLATTVVRALIENPPAIEDLTRVDLPPAKLLQEWGAVLGGLYSLASKVCFFIQLHLVGGPTGLEDERSKWDMEQASKCNRWIKICSWLRVRSHLTRLVRFNRTRACFLCWSGPVVQVWIHMVQTKQPDRDQSLSCSHSNKL